MFSVFCGFSLLPYASNWIHILPPLNVDLDPGGYLEDLGLILEVLGVMVTSI